MKPIVFARVMFVIFLIGCAGLAPVFWQAKRDYRVAKSYVESEAEILEFIPINTGYDTRPGKRVDRSTRPSFVFRFHVKDGPIVTTRGYDAYGGREAPPSEWNTISPGEKVPCWYDPSDPQKAVLSRRFNPHFYWLLAWPLSIMGFSGLILRECLRRAAPPSLKGIEKGRKLEWRLPTVASHRGMTGCLGVALVILVLLASGFVMAALDYQVVAYRFRFLSNLLGFNMNGWWIVALVTAVVALVFLWAFLVHLRWITLPEPEVEVNATRLLRGESTKVLVRQAGPIQAKSYTISLVCEVNGTPGKPPAIQKKIVERNDVRAEADDSALEFPIDLKIPDSARSTCHSVALKDSNKPNADLVKWYVRVERKMTEKTVFTSDFELLVGPEKS